MIGWWLVVGGIVGGELLVVFVGSLSDWLFVERLVGRFGFGRLIGGFSVLSIISGLCACCLVG